MTVFTLGDASPDLHKTSWIAPSAVLIGNVKLHAQSSVWFGSVLRGDNEKIEVGEGANIQDLCVLHTDPGYPLHIGSYVTVGHQVTLHGCKVGDSTLIGMQSTVLNGAHIGKHCLVGAGSLITEGKIFPDGALIVGRPAKLVRMLEPEEIERLLRSAQRYIENAQRYREQPAYFIS